VEVATEDATVLRIGTPAIALVTWIVGESTSGQSRDRQQFRTPMMPNRTIATIRRAVCDRPVYERS